MIIWGPVAELAEVLPRLGARRALVLSGPTRRHVDAVVAAVAALEPRVFDGAQVHVPAEVLARAEAELGDADAIIAVGGGSAIGLGKALRLTHDLRFAAVPTTYAGSEMTTLYGITTSGAKRTGRDARVRPDVVVYDAALSASMPIDLTIQSLSNALAHCVSALSTDSLTGADRTAALDAAGVLVQAMEALRGAAAAGAAIDRGTPGTQHRLAHLLGGSLNLDHAALHAVLLPSFVEHLRARAPALVRELEIATGAPGLDHRLRDFLQRAGAPVHLEELLPF